MSAEPFDCVVIGGGPAGLSAAIYMARFLRSTLVIDSLQGRSSFAQVNENYLGFPKGVAIRRLKHLGQEQATRFGAKLCVCTATAVHKVEPGALFKVRTDAGDHLARTVIFCTGVTDIWPNVPRVGRFIGRSLFWCITCDGFRALGKRLVLFGCDDEAATTACQFKNYTDQITFVTGQAEDDCSASASAELNRHGIPIVNARAVRLVGEPDALQGVELTDGRVLPADVCFSLLGCKPNTKLTRDLGVACDSRGYIAVDGEGYTSVPGIFAAGDVAGKHSHQVASAVHLGAEAAQTANYYLYAQYQRNLEDRSAPGSREDGLTAQKRAAER